MKSGIRTLFRAFLTELLSKRATLLSFYVDAWELKELREYVRKYKRTVASDLSPRQLAVRRRNGTLPGRDVRVPLLILVVSRWNYGRYIAFMNDDSSVSAAFYAFISSRLNESPPREA